MSFAGIKANTWVLAGTLQMPQETFWPLQECCKSTSKNFLAFAGMLQTPQKTFWTLQERCKCHKKLFGLCRNAANTFEKRAVRMRGEICPSEGRGDKTT